MNTPTNSKVSDQEVERELKEELPPESGHHKPPLALLFIWVLLFVFIFYYLYTYMFPALMQWQLH
jgi:hypothetical protein